MPDNSPLPGRHVYLSFTQEDDGTAAEIARDLEQRQAERLGQHLADASSPTGIN